MLGVSRGISAGIFGVLAVSLTFGAVQLASGRDLAGAGQGTSAASVNRAAKSDRATLATGPAAPTRTISLHFDSLADTSVLIRLPISNEANKDAGKQARDSSARRSLLLPPDHKPTVACEPVVSVLSEVAKRLGPGRCIT
jgi:hypothetical protein